MQYIVAPNLHNISLPRRSTEETLWRIEINFIMTVNGSETDWKFQQGKDKRFFENVEVVTVE